MNVSGQNGGWPALEAPTLAPPQLRVQLGRWALRLRAFGLRAVEPCEALFSLTVLAVNYVGDGLRDALDPRIRGR